MSTRVTVLPSLYRSGRGARYTVMASAPKSTSHASGMAACRKEGDLDVAVVDAGGVGDLDDEEDVAGARVPGVAIGPTLEDGQVRLRRVVTPEHHGVLHVDDRALEGMAGQQVVHTPDAARVAVPDGGHGDDLAGDELDAVVVS